MNLISQVRTGQNLTLGLIGGAGSTQRRLLVAEVQKEAKHRQMHTSRYKI